MGASHVLEDTVYHIYAKDKCLYNCLPEDDFAEKWEMLNIMVGIMKTDYNSDDLSFEKVSGIVSSDIEPSY